MKERGGGKRKRHYLLVSIAGYVASWFFILVVLFHLHFRTVMIGYMHQKLPSVILTTVAPKLLCMILQNLTNIHASYPVVVIDPAIKII